MRFGPMPHKGMAEPQLQSNITCPHCGHQATEQMPINVCVVIYACKGCGDELRTPLGDCCVFCCYGSVPCPHAQEARGSEHYLILTGQRMPKGPKGEKRPAEVIGAAIMVGRIATGEIEDPMSKARIDQGWQGRGKSSCG